MCSAVLCVVQCYEYYGACFVAEYSGGHVSTPPATHSIVLLLQIKRLGLDLECV